MKDKVLVKNNPVVSVIIPTYNCSRYIDKAIQSVLIQDISFEIIIIDDGSSDNTKDLLSIYKNLDNFIYIRNEINIGVAASRNLGIKLSHGKYIAFLDADDWWEKNKLREQIAVLEKNQGVLCYTGRRLVRDDGVELGKIITVDDKIDYRQLIYHNSITCSSVMVIKRVADEFPMKYSQYQEDYITWLSILKKYGYAYGINKPLVYYRLSKHGKNRNKLKSALMTYHSYRVLNFSVVTSIKFTICHLAHGLLKYIK